MAEKETTSPENARNPVQRRIIQEYLEQGEDPFDRRTIEKIYDEDEDGNKTYNQIIAENQYWYAIPCLWPMNGSEQHFIIISQRNDVTSIAQIDEKEFEAFFDLCEQLKFKYSIEGGAYCMRFGTPAKSGTTVTHLHGHLISPKGYDSVSFHIGNYNNAIKKKLEVTGSSQAIYANNNWTARVHGSDRDHYVFEPRPSVAQDLDKLFHHELNYLLDVIKTTLGKENIDGGGLCIPFGTLLPRNKPVQIHLGTTNETSTFEIIIKQPV